MTAFASLHTAMPSSRLDKEVSYKGYHRVPLECEVGSLKMHAIFPEVEEGTDLIATHFAIGYEEEGNGKLFMAWECTPHIPLKIMQSGHTPNVFIQYPDTLAKSARIAHQMAALGKLLTHEIDPKFFENINDNLQAHGIPILTVVRGAAAGWIGKMANMPSLNGAIN